MTAREVLEIARHMKDRHNGKNIPKVSEDDFMQFLNEVESVFDVLEQRKSLTQRIEVEKKYIRGSKNVKESN